MNPEKQWVNQLNRVSSKTKTKIFSLVFVLTIISASALSFSSASQTAASDITAENIIGLTNASRAGTGESILAANSKLSLAAKAKADDMLAKNYFSHTSPKGVTPWKWIDGENYDYSYAGENLAMDFQSAEKMEDAWMKSPTHRANILNEKYKDIGVAVKAGNINGSETILAVVMFGSGDKNNSSATDVKKEISKSDKAVEEKKNIPVLSVGEEKKVAASFDGLMITSPQAGERLSGDEVKIAGRAQPGSEVNVFDNGDFIYLATADANGWFSLDKNFSEGEHNLGIKSNSRDFQEYQTSFFVDQKKPEIEYHLFADRNNPQQFFLETSANKKGCTFQLDGDSRYVAEGSKVLFAIDSKKSSAILRVSDQVGNKDFRQINMANYYAGSGNNKNNISEKLAALMFSPEDVFALNSGREAMKNNLGIAMGGLNNH
ncbi:MAG: CAP domain-containing protein [Candidatus Moraniibacteriota bacterium]